MRSPRLAVFLPLLAALLLSGGSALAVNPNASTPFTVGRTADGSKLPVAVTATGDGGFGAVQVTGSISGTVTSTPSGVQQAQIQATTSDGGSLPVVPTVPCSLRTFHSVAQTSSTGPTNAAQFNASDAGLCIRVQCGGAAAVGACGAKGADAGLAVTCASPDAGATLGCPVRAQFAPPWTPQMGPGENACSHVSYSGTTICVWDESNY